MAVFNITYQDGVLKIGFGDPAGNDEICRFVLQEIRRMKNESTFTGGLLKINGPCSVPVAFLLAHELAHLFEAIAVFDPKLNKYVVSISHSSKYTVGDLIE